MKIASTPALLYGVIGGLTICVFSLVLYTMGAESFLNYAWFNYIILLIVAVLAGLAKKKLDSGFLPFSDALKVVFGAMMLAMFIQLLFNYVLFNFIDVPFSEAIKQMGMDKAEQFMKSMNVPQDTIDKAIEDEARKNTNSFGSLALGFAIFAIPAFLVSLIIAAIIKKNKPEFHNTFSEL